MFVQKMTISDDPFSEPLRCPQCGDQYMHHGAVEIYSREYEDATTKAMRIESVPDNPEHCDGVVVKLIQNPNNPSRRRDGIVIDFYCESCSLDTTDEGVDKKPFRLAIVQHKGETFFHWVE